MKEHSIIQYEGAIVATRTRSNPSSRMSRGGDHDNMNGGSREGMSSENRGGLRRTLSDGIHVTAEMPSPKVARITIDIDWQHLVSRVARTVRHKIKKRTGRTTTTTSPRRTARARRSA